MNIEAVRVHVASTDVQLGSPPPVRRPRRTVFTTITLTADEPAKQILPASAGRVSAQVQALDADVTLSGNESNAASLSGTTVPKANTAPWPVEHDGVVFAGASLSGTSTARVSVTAVYED